MCGVMMVMVMVVVVVVVMMMVMVMVMVCVRVCVHVCVPGCCPCKKCFFIYIFSAILKAMTFKHQTILQNCLEPIHKKLSTFYCGSEDEHVIHPKLKKIYDLLIYWLNNDPMSRTIILIHRMFEFIAPNLQTFLSSIKGVNVNIYPTHDVTESAYLEVFYKSNVILVHENNDLQSCPWEYFQYVIQFEQSSASWIQVVLKSNPELKQFLTFETFALDVVESGKLLLFIEFCVLICGSMDDGLLFIVY